MLSIPQLFCRPIAYYVVISTTRVLPLNQTLAGFPSSREPMVFFQDIIHAATEEDALDIATSRFWENILIESAGEDMLETMYRAARLGRWLPDNFYPYCTPIYAHQLRRCWKIVYASMKSFHEMREAFAKLGVIETQASKGKAIRKK